MSSQVELTSGREALLAGDPYSAVSILSDLVAISPADVEARYWLASAKLTAGDADAHAVMDEARILHTLALARTMGVDIERCRSDAAYGADIANRLYGRNLVGMSGVVRALSLSAGEIDVNGLVNYGLALQHQGRLEEACQVLRLASEQFPSAGVHQFLLYPLLLCDDGDARFSAEARVWARLYAPTFPSEPHHNPPRLGRKLRIGYLAPSFANSQARQFIAPLLEHHDKTQVTVTLYPAREATELDWPAWIHVHPIGHLNDADAADLIRRDQIDVLIDCWGHTAGSRLAVLAKRPAPVQAGFINFVQTTGLDQVDYILHADSDDPPDVEGYFTEQIWRIGPVFNAFRPAAGRLPPVPSPMSATGQVTFGSFNHPVKLSDWTLDAWGAILRQAPTSRLLLKYRYFDDPVMQRVTQARFAARGVPPERLAFAGHSSGEDYFRSFGEVDLMLDAWPAPGSTTTLEALTNGVPVLGLDRPSIAGHYTRSILAAAGLPELIATDPDDYVERALSLTSDPAALDALRARVRPGFEQGPLCDGVSYARRLEAAFAEMFDQWRSGRQPAAVSAA